jgi:hypothetical protein
MYPISLLKINFLVIKLIFDKYTYYKIIDIYNIMDTDITQRKLDLYEKFFMEMKQIEDDEEEAHQKWILTQQVAKRNNEDIGENFIYLDEFRDLNELSIKEKKIIAEQNNLHNYEKLKGTVNKFQNFYSIVKYATYIPKWVPFV